MLPATAAIRRASPGGASAALGRTVSFAGVVSPCRCGASLTKPSFASVCQTITGLQTLKRPSQSRAQGERGGGVAHARPIGLAADLDESFKKLTDQSGLREASLKSMSISTGKSPPVFRTPGRRIGALRCRPELHRRRRRSWSSHSCMGGHGQRLLSNLSVALHRHDRELLDWLPASMRP